MNPAPHYPDDVADDIADGLAYSAELAAHVELAARVEQEAADATRLPWWFWEAAAVVLVLSIAASAVWPLGVAS